MRLVIFIILLTTLLPAQNTVAQRRTLNVQMGGRFAYSVPTSQGKTTSIGFSDVAGNGLLAGYFGRWFYAKRLSLGWDAAYQYQGLDKNFWELGNYGEVKGSYQTIQLLAEGNYYFSHDETRPYAGIVFGGLLLRNTLTFNSSNILNQSVAYTAQNIMPGFGPQAGCTFQLSRKTTLDLHLRYVLIPNLEPTYIQDENLGLITQNPHGAQNHLSISIGLLFD